ncbi:hypothetical protein ABK040_002710 [Willaertia magna]
MITSDFPVVPSSIDQFPESSYLFPENINSNHNNNQNTDESSFPILSSLHKQCINRQQQQDKEEEETTKEEEEQGKKNYSNEKINNLETITNQNSPYYPPLSSPFHPITTTNHNNIDNITKNSNVVDSNIPIMDNNNSNYPTSVIDHEYQSFLNNNYQIINDLNNKIDLNNIDLSIVYNYSKLNSKTITLKSLLDFGSNLSLNTLLNSSAWLFDNLKIRIAKQVYLLDNMPLGLNLMPSIRVVRDWYLTSFYQLQNFPHKPKNSNEELQFTKMLNEIYARHSPTNTSVAKGVLELKREMVNSIYSHCNVVDNHNTTILHNNIPLDNSNTTMMMENPFEYCGMNLKLKESLDSFYINRIGIRMLIGQHLTLHQQFTTASRDNIRDHSRHAHSSSQQYIGLICKHTNPSKVAQNAIEDATEICRNYYGKAPNVKIIGNLNLTFPYVESHLYYVLFELLKNSMRAVVEKYYDYSEEKLPNIKIIISDNKSGEDISIKISDEGNGIPRRDMPKLYSYLYTSSQMLPLKENAKPFAGLGFGLPLSKLYAKYWGGDLILMSLNGYGTDAFIYLHRLGNKEETIPL